MRIRVLVVVIFGLLLGEPATAQILPIPPDWQIERADDTATLVVTPLEKLRQKDRSAIAAEGRRLLRFAAADAGSHEVRID